MRAHRRSWSHPLLVCYAYARGDEGPTRVGITVGRRVGNAIVRNRVKRRLREVVRAALPRLSSGYDLVLIGRTPIAASSLDDLSRAFGALATRAQLWLPAPVNSADAPNRDGDALSADGIA